VSPLLFVMSAVLLGSPLSTGAGPCFWPPVEAPIVDHFRDPGCRWCAGNRGLEYDVDPGTPVRALAAGTVTFAGVVAGTRYVVIAHADGRRATYGQLAATTLAGGHAVAAGAVVGTSTAGLYVGLREGDVYVDPEPYIGRASPRPYLVPVDGTPPRPPPPARITCPAAGLTSDAAR